MQYFVKLLAAYIAAFGTEQGTAINDAGLSLWGADWSLATVTYTAQQIPTPYWVGTLEFWKGCEAHNDEWRDINSLRKSVMDHVTPEQWANATAHLSL